MAMEASRSGTFDVIHSHLHVHALVFSRLISTPIVTTLHGVAWDLATHPCCCSIPRCPLCRSARASGRSCPSSTMSPPSPTASGRVRSRSGVATAVSGLRGPHGSRKGARPRHRDGASAGLPLRLAGIVEDRHRDFFESKVLAARSGDIEYLGPLDRDDLWRLLGRAHAMVMPLRWHEPFGLVAVESLAAGTPVIAWRMGALPEIIDDGVSGFLVDDVAGAVGSVERVSELDRAVCRTIAEARFADSVMAAAYSEVYRRLSATTSGRGPAGPAQSPP